MERLSKPDRFLCAAFLLLLQLPLLAGLFGIDRADNTQENRALAKWPQPPASSAEALAWPRGFQLYFDDHFALRNTLTYLYSHALYDGLGVVPFGKVKVSGD